MSDPDGMPPARYAARLEAARQAAAAVGLDGLLIGVGADLRYLTGYDAMALERLTLLVLPAVGGTPATLIAPRLEATPARTCPAAITGSVVVATWEETEDPMDLVAARLGDVLAVDQVADATNGQAEHHAEYGGVRAGGAGQLLAKAVGPASHGAADDGAVDRNAAFRDAEDIDEAVDR